MTATSRATQAARERGCVDLTHLRHAAVGWPRLGGLGAAVANVGEVAEGAAGLRSPRVPAPCGVLSSPGRCSHSDTALYISSVVLHTKQTGRHENDFTAHGYE